MTSIRIEQIRIKSIVAKAIEELPEDLKPAFPYEVNGRGGDLNRTVGAGGSNENSVGRGYTPKDSKFYTLTTINKQNDK